MYLIVGNTGSLLLHFWEFVITVVNNKVQFWGLCLEGGILVDPCPSADTWFGDGCVDLLWCSLTLTGVATKLQQSISVPLT